MDLRIIKVLDIVLDENEETGEVVTQKLYLPSILRKKDIEDINPGVTSVGRLYKNISNISTYSGKTYTVVGNYIQLNKKIEETDYGPNKIGYINGRN